MSRENLAETVRRGLADELSAAYQYTRLAARVKDEPLKKAFLNYAMEEMAHGQRLLNLLERLGETTLETPLRIVPEDDLPVELVEYIAQEEAAVFYYQVLEKLYQDEEVRLSVRQIIEEEQRHLSNITEILHKLKSGEYQDG